MNFNEATGRLIELGVTLRELADEMGVSHSALIQARMDPSASGYRKPPDGWRPALEKLARARGGELSALADALREAGDS